MNKELQNATVNNVAIPTFKNAELQKAAEEIARVGASMRDQNRELAKILGRVKTTRCFIEDGFKSVQEFAETTFGIAKSMAYQLAKVGERFYNVDSETAKKASAMLPASNLAEIAKMTDAEIESAIADGKISSKSTQKELRAVASGEKSEKQSVLVDYKVEGVLISAAPVLVENIYNERIPLEKLETSFMFRGEVKKSRFTLKDERGEDHTYNVWVDSNGTVARFTAEKCPRKVSTPAEEGKPKFSKEQLLAMLADLEAGE